MSSNARLNNYFLMKGITQEVIAKDLGVSQAYVSAILSGSKGIGGRMAIKIAKKYNLSVNWIMTGEGEMILKPDVVNEEIPKYENHSNLLNENKRLIKENTELKTKNEFLNSEIARLKDELLNSEKEKTQILFRFIDDLQKAGTKIPESVGNFRKKEE